MTLMSPVLTADDSACAASASVDVVVLPLLQLLHLWWCHGIGKLLSGCCRPTDINSLAPCAAVACRRCRTVLVVADAGG
jgi:hypothetical protein